MRGWRSQPGLRASCDAGLPRRKSAFTLVILRVANDLLLHGRFLTSLEMTVSMTIKPDTATIRRATVDDAATLSTLAARTFSESFGRLYPDEDLHAFLADAYAVEKQRMILAHPDYAVWLLERDGRAIGHAAA